MQIVSIFYTLLFLLLFVVFAHPYKLFLTLLLVNCHVSLVVSLRCIKTYSLVLTLSSFRNANLRSILGRFLGCHLACNLQVVYALLIPLFLIRLILIIFGRLGPVVVILIVIVFRLRLGLFFLFFLLLFLFLIIIIVVLMVRFPIKSSNPSLVHKFNSVLNFLLLSGINTRFELLLNFPRILQLPFMQ